MPEDELRKRDEVARDRDEVSRGRDENARDRDQISQERTSAARRVQTWATFVLIFLVVGLFYTQSQRQDAIDTIRESALRTEEASIHMEEILVEIRTEEFSPESQAFNASVRQAIRDIQIVREILCDMEDPPESCIDEGEPSGRS